MHAIQILKLCIVTSLAATMIMGVVFMIRTDENDDLRSYAKQAVYDNKVRRTGELKQVVPTDPSYLPTKSLTLQKNSAQQMSVHIFYYPWYGNPESDGKYYHWNHPLLKPSPRSKMEPGRHNPPSDVASNFYPQLGPYSSRGPSIIDKHMKWISSAGIDVLAISWYPAGKSDEQGYPWDSLMPTLLNASEKYKLKVAFHLEPYPEQTALSVRNDIEYIVKNYGHFPSFYKTSSKKHASKQLPLFYIYDSYKIPSDEWTKILLPGGSSTIRNTDFDAILIGLALKVNDVNTIAQSGFDGVYTYFAADGFTEGSTMNNWPKMSQLCANNSILFIPSIGPGYDDTRVRPWNSQNIRSRANGSYYKQHFEMAHASKADLLSITSFNEWHESTQIEPVIPFKDDNGTLYVYENYEKGPEQYLQLTHEMINKFFVPHHENIPLNIAKIV